MAKKPYSLQYSYVKGTGDTQANMRKVAKRLGISFRPVHTPYVGHVAFHIQGALTKLRKFLDEVWLGSAKSMIEKPTGGWVG